MIGLQKVFSYGDTQVRTVIKNESIWFVGKDVASILGYSDASSTVSKKVDSEDRGLAKMATPSGLQEMTVINESGLYSLILGSKLPAAKSFKRWVTSEVLPTIRKHGAYMTDDVLERTINDPDYMIGLITALKDEKQKRIEAEKTVNILTHVNKTYTTTEIAKELGFRSAVALNRDLQKKKVQFNQNGTWVLYSKYADKGYVDIKQEVLDNGKVIYHRRFTQMGREFLVKLYGMEEKKNA